MFCNLKHWGFFPENNLEMFPLTWNFVFRSSKLQWEKKNSGPYASGV